MKKETKDYHDVRINHYDKTTDEWYVDAWLTDNEDEEGIVVARINAATDEVVYVDDLEINTVTSPMVQSAIDQFITRPLNK